MMFRLPNIKKTYSINLMWINNKPDPDQAYIFGRNEEKAIQVLEDALRWKEANPEAQVNFWFDSQMVSEKSIQTTQQLMLARKENKTRIGDVELKDLRDIDIIKQNPDIFSENLPIYFRVDLAKFIICLHQIESVGQTCAIFSDLGVYSVLNKEELFNGVIIPNLNEYGILFNNSGHFENQFIQVINKPAIIKALKVLVNANMHRAITTLNLQEGVGGKYKDNIIAKLSCCVFASICQQLPGLIANYHDGIALQMNTKLYNEKSDEWIDYKPEEHGYLPLGNLLSIRGMDFYIRRYIDDEEKMELVGIYLQFPKHNIDKNLISREDISIKLGTDHWFGAPETHPSTQLPANGSPVYKCQYYSLLDSPELDSQMRSRPN